MTRKCLDSYALVEIARGNSRFTSYLSEEVVITHLTLVEFYGVLLREEGEKTAEYWFGKLTPYAAPVSLDILKAAVVFRYLHRKQRISFFDAVGYLYSLNNHFLFVTGDKEFKGRENVEHKKAI